MSDRIQELNKIFIDVFKDESIVLNRDTNASSIDNWSSLNNMHLIVAIENYYKIRFDLKEIQSLKDVGQLCECVDKYLAV
jgi:acyl carrier protein